MRGRTEGVRKEEEGRERTNQFRSYYGKCGPRAKIAGKKFNFLAKLYK